MRRQDQTRIGNIDLTRRPARLITILKLSHQALLSGNLLTKRFGEFILSQFSGLML